MRQCFMIWIVGCCVGCGGPSATVGGCEGASDGTVCEPGRICVAERCLLSRCGDHVRDAMAGEQCDDGNAVDGDGCQIDCTVSCASAEDCSDGQSCNGEEVCAPATHACVPAPDNAPDGTSCRAGGVGAGICRLGVCVSPGCGNGAPDAGEECDDANAQDGDGCNNDCTFTCTAENGALRCDDGNPCTGIETCDAQSHLCRPGTVVVCADADACTMDLCWGGTGACEFPLADNDGDGEADRGAYPSCGTDCNDSDPSTCAACPELCDAIDQDCDGDPMPSTTPLWYRDCDGDGFAAAGAESMPYCGDGAPAPTDGCAWTPTAPVAPDVDCLDADPDVHPGQTAFFATPISGADAAVDFDYDCSAVEEPQHTVTGASPVCLVLHGACSVSSSGTPPGWAASSVPECGATSAYLSCGIVRGGACGQLTRMQAQSCR